jgi:two-component SAPR family response regulator
VRKTYYIIVVEEDEVVYQKIVRALEKLGCNHDIRRVSTQAELDDEMVRLAPDFVICDHSRSNWNSFAVLEQVRAFQASMPFALIGGPDEGTQASLLANGVDACVDHDHLGELAPTVEEMLKRRTEQQWACVEEIRRSLPPMEPTRRRGGRSLLQARAG